MTRSIRLWSLTLLLVVLSTVLFACGGGDEEADATEDDGEISKLVVGTDATYAPMEYMDDSGEIVGIDIDIVDAIAEEIGVEVEYKNIGWEPLFTAVDNRAVEVADLSITHSYLRG